MKILVCTDGSEQSRKALQKASLIAEGSFVEEIAIIYVYEGTLDLSVLTRGETTVKKEDVELYRKLQEEHREDRKKILSEALEFFKGKDVKVRTIFKEGHPAQTIVDVACQEGFDMIVVGSRGLGGLKRVLLGSVSTAIVQEAKNTSVLTVK